MTMLQHIDDQGATTDPQAHAAALGWAMNHAPTREAYRRSTGEDAGPVLDRYREWVQENLTGA